MNRTPLNPGHLLGEGRYVIRRLVSDKGGYGLTYEASKTVGAGEGGIDVAAKLGLRAYDRVAIKEFYPLGTQRRGWTVVPDSEQDDGQGLFERGLKRFQREAERLCLLTCVRALQIARLTPDIEAPAMARIETALRSETIGNNINIAIGLLAGLPEDCTTALRDGLARAPLPAVYDYFLSGGTAYYVLEFLEGGTLSGRLSRSRVEQGSRPVSLHGSEYVVTRPWSADRVRAFALDAMDALAQLHGGVPGQQIIHCDLKPGNIMFRSAESPKLVLIDFGLARNVIGDSSTSMIGGTTGFAPCELDPNSGGGFASRPGAKNAVKLGPYTDIYSLAAVLRIVATGIEGRALPPAWVRQSAVQKRLPDPFTLLPPYPEGFPEDLRRMIEAGLAIEPGRRPQSVAQWRAMIAPPAQETAQPAEKWKTGDVALLAAPEHGSEPRKSEEKRRKPPVSRNTITLGALGAALLLLAVLVSNPFRKHDTVQPEGNTGTTLTTAVNTPRPEQATPGLSASTPDATTASAVAIPTGIPQQTAAAEPEPSPPATVVTAPAMQATPPPASIPPPRPLARVVPAFEDSMPPTLTPRTINLAAMGIVVSRAVQPARVNDLIVRGLKPNDPVIVTAVNRDVDTVKINDLLVSSCDGGSTVTALRRADTGQKTCVTTADGDELHFGE